MTKTRHKVKDVPKGLGPRVPALTNKQRYELFSSALAAGSSRHWCKLATVTDDRCDGDMEKLWSMVQDGKQFTIRDIEDSKSYTFKSSAFKRGEAAMVQDPEGLHAWAEIINGTWSGQEADTWFQFVCFSEIIYS